MEERKEELRTMSYSRLSDFDRNGAIALLDRPEVRKGARRKGSLVNDLLFGNADFNQIYHLKLYEDPTASLLKLADIIIANYAKIPDIPEILEIIEKNGLWTNTKKPEKKLENFNKPEFWEYLKINFEESEKMLITPSLLADAEELVYILKTHKHSRHFFRPNNFRLVTEHYFTVVYQDKIRLRGIVDMIVIDDDNKTVRIVDLKTGAKRYNDFQQSVLEFRYYLQEAVYMTAVDSIKEELGISEYTTLPFQFLFIGVKEKIPVVYEVDESWHRGAIRGFRTVSGYNYRGMDELIDQVLYHHKHKIYELDYDTVIKNGLLNFRTVYVE